jgi:hypothetical protein
MLCEDHDESQLQRRPPLVSGAMLLSLDPLVLPLPPSVYDQHMRLHCPQFIMDVKLATMITGTAHAFTPAALEASERSKETKHGPFYSPIGFSFLPFAASCLGRLGPTAIRFLAALAHLELA